MLARDSQSRLAGRGLQTFEAEFFTDHLIIRGETWGPDSRLSDHVNSTSASIDLRPLSVVRLGDAKTTISTDGTTASLAKRHLLLILPLTEEIRGPGGNSAWAPVTLHRAWAIVGDYEVAGMVATDQGVNDDRIALRQLEQKRFLAFNAATITGPGGEKRECRTVIVNGERMEFLALVSDR